jgi:hypothetical protein
MVDPSNHRANAVAQWTSPYLPPVIIDIIAAYAHLDERERFGQLLAADPNGISVRINTKEHYGPMTYHMVPTRPLPSPEAIFTADIDVFCTVGGIDRYGLCYVPYTMPFNQAYQLLKDNKFLTSFIWAISPSPEEQILGML